MRRCFSMLGLCLTACLSPVEELPLNTARDATTSVSTTGAGCPASAWEKVTSCVEGLQCTYGSETCCGKTSPSMICGCHGGSWGCFYTDACLAPRCAVDVDAGFSADGG
jgi:hypothetical protein